MNNYKQEIQLRNKTKFKCLIYEIHFYYNYKFIILNRKNTLNSNFIF